jgi:DHA2 family methylenomycin A resistance protein-like MFS transporter
MLAVALPEVRDDFSVGHAEIGWLVSAYLIAMAVAQPLGGRLGDQLGRARVFQAGLIAFLVLSVAAAASPSFPVLVLLRTGQALVGAAAIPNGMAMLRETIPSSRLGQSTGLTGAAISASAALGPPLGALLLSAGSWRLLFLVNIPLVALALFSFALLAYPRTAPRRIELDWLGALAFGALLVALTVVLNSLSGDASVTVLVVGIVALAGLAVVFLQRQRSSSAPVAEWRLFRNRSYAAATSYVLLSNLVMYTTLLTIPFFLVEAQDRPERDVGITLAAMSILSSVVAPLGGRFSDAFGRRTGALLGSVIVLGAVIALLAGLTDEVSVWYLASCLAVLGLGLAFSFGAASTAAIESAPRELAGAAAGTNSMMRYLGSIVGAGILGAVLSSSETPELALFRLIFAVLVGMAVAATAATLFIHRFVGHEHGTDARVSEPVALPRSSAAGRAGG